MRLQTLLFSVPPSAPTPTSPRILVPTPTSFFYGTVVLIENNFIKGSLTNPYPHLKGRGTGLGNRPDDP